MNRLKLKIGSRESKLAVVQAQLIMNHISKLFPAMELELITMKTTGDQILDRTLDQIGGKGLFVKELETGLRNAEIDIAVHSLKDMPAVMPEDLPLGAYSTREDPRDVLILPEHMDFIDKSKPVGCSSARRKLQLLALRPGLAIEPVRGNVLTRLNKLDQGQFSALVLAYAGIRRLGLEHRVSSVFKTEEILPAAGQGILAVQARKGEFTDLLQAINDRDAADCALAEREFIRVLDGGCSAPIAAYAEVHGDEINLSGLYVDEQGGRQARGQISGPRVRAQQLGAELAARLKR